MDVGRELLKSEIPLLQQSLGKKCGGSNLRADSQNADSGDDWREHFIKGTTISEIARDLKVSRNTVRKVLRSGETAFEYQREVQPRPKPGRWTADLDELLAANAAKSSREQLARLRLPLSTCLPESSPGVFATLTTIAFDDSSLRWLETRP